MDNPFYAMLFAEDLIAYILKKFNIEWIQTEGVGPLRGHIPRNRFRSEIGEAVSSIIMQNKDTCKNNFIALVQQKLTLEKYRYECSVTAVHTFKDGFQPEIYLNICAALAAHAWHSFATLKEDIARDVASASAQVLAFIINFYIYKGEFNPSTDWFLLAVKAQKVRRGIARKEMKKTELDSGEC